MLESLLFFLPSELLVSLQRINRNGRKKIKQQAEMIELLKELKERNI